MTLLIVLYPLRSHNLKKVQPWTNRVYLTWYFFKPQQHFQELISPTTLQTSLEAPLADYILPGRISSMFSLHHKKSAELFFVLPRLAKKLLKRAQPSATLTASTAKKKIINDSVNFNFKCTTNYNLPPSERSISSTRKCVNQWVGFVYSSELWVCGSESVLRLMYGKRFELIFEIISHFDYLSGAQVV